MRCLRLKTPGHTPGPILARPSGRSDGLGPVMEKAESQSTNKVGVQVNAFLRLSALFDLRFAVSWHVDTPKETA